MNLKSKNHKMRAKNLLTLALTVMALVVVSGTGKAQGPTGPTQASTCCPPVDNPTVRGMFRHQGNAANNYNMALDLAGPPATTNAFVNGLRAYLTYLQFLCPQTVGLKAEFFRGAVTAPPPTPPNSPAGPLVGADATTPMSSYTIVGGSTQALLNTALTVGMNNFAYSNNQWYRIRVRITGVNAQGQPVNCGFNAIECARDDTFAFVYGTGRMSGSTYTN